MEGREMKLLFDAGSVLIFGPQGSYQTVVAFEIAAAVASGLPAFGNRGLSHRGAVAYLYDRDRPNQKDALYDREVFWRENRKLAMGDLVALYPLAMGDPVYPSANQECGCCSSANNLMLSAGQCGYRNPADVWKTCVAVN
jgi:hypothetical protein